VCMHACPRWPDDSSTPDAGQTSLLADRPSLINVITCGVSFLFLFTAFQTTSFFEPSVIGGTTSTNESYSTIEIIGNVSVLVNHTVLTNSTSNLGYNSLCVLYATFAPCNFLAPAIVAITGAKYGMIFGAIGYCAFIASLIQVRFRVAHVQCSALVASTYVCVRGHVRAQVNEIAVYFMSVVIGMSAAVLWAAQGTFIVRNSTDLDRGRKTGMFWAIFQMCLMLGGCVSSA
jgi:hypothetical protein